MCRFHFALSMHYTSEWNSASYDEHALVFLAAEFLSFLTGLKQFFLPAIISSKAIGSGDLIQPFTSFLDFYSQADHVQLLHSVP